MPYVAEGTGCPPGPADVWPELVESRAPLLKGAEILSVEVSRSSELVDAAPRSEVTRIVARVSPDRATAWDNEYAMAMSGDPGARGVPGVAADAQWVSSGAFDSVVSAGDDLDAIASIDPESGTVDLLLYEIDYRS